MRRLPDNIHVLKGNPSKRRHLPGIAPEIPEKTPDPPGFLSEAAAAEWRRLAAELVRCGLLTGLDIAAFAVYCQSFGTWVAATEAAAEGTDEERRVLAGVARGAMRDMVRYARLFGMTPSSRAGVVGGTRLDTSKFDGLLG